MVRRAVYLVVFNMETFLESPAKAFSFLDFWLNTIFIQANGAPIFLIGTRGDQVKGPKLHSKISKLFEERYSSLLNDQLVKNEDKLFFFPVDNTSSEKKDLERFKRLTALTEEKISNDKLPPLLTEGEPLPYIEDRVPIPWLNFIDELRKISSEKKEEEEDDDDDEFEAQPYLFTGLVSESNADSDDSFENAMKIAERCKVFEGLTTEEEKKTRLEALLKNLHELGLVIFFSGSDSLKSYVILQPKWLMDQICYIIRGETVMQKAISAL